MVFGVPTFVISLVCYAICCLAPADDDDTRPSSDDEADDSEAAECKLCTCLTALVSYELFICNKHEGCIEICRNILQCCQCIRKVLHDFHFEDVSLMTSKDITTQHRCVSLAKFS